MKLSWKASKKYTLIRVLCNSCNPLLSIIVAYNGKRIINALSEIERNEKVFWYASIFSMILCFMGIFLKRLEQYSRLNHDEILKNEIVNTLMVHSMQMDIEYFDSCEYYDKLKASFRDVYSIVELLWNGLNLLTSVISFVSIWGIVFFINPLYVILLTVISVLSIFVSNRHAKYMFELSMEQMKSERKKSYLQGLATEKRFAQDIRLYNLNRYLIEKYQILWKKVFLKKKKEEQKRMILNLILECIPEIVVGLFCISIGIDIYQGRLTLGDYSFYAGLISQFVAALAVISASVIELYDNGIRIKNYMDVFAYENHVIDDGKQQLKEINNLEFENVYFRYPNSKEYVLEGVSFKIDRQTRTAFVGINGAGKSTLIKLILRMYDVTTGCIKINGKDIREYTIESLRMGFGVYLQNMENYYSSLRENILIGDIYTNHLDGEILELLQEMDCMGILQKGSNGLDSELTHNFSENGIELSGGENQKLAICRALLKKNVAYILDEPSSSLDPKTEDEIFKVLNQATKNHLTIFTSHRLNNISLADQIIVLEKGKVIESGTQEQLLKNKKRYAELYNYQQRKFKIS